MAGASLAAAPPPRPARAPAVAKSNVPQLTAGDLAAFLDGIVPLQLQRDDIAGAAVAVVADGKVLFERGYGYADYAKRIPVSPQTTLFRPGSISKLFTWTSVMQLVQEGKLDLDADVNQYLDFRIPSAFGRPITIRDLMTHTPGFEEADKDLILIRPGPIPSLGAYLKAHLPRRIFPPGEIPAYSNYGAALAGYIVQRVSGEPFAQYAAAHIFAPLGMTHSTFVQPLPAALSPFMSQGYLRASDGAKPYELIAAYPAGALATSADDISRFMLAQLGLGQIPGEPKTTILTPATARLMQTRQRGLAAAIPAMCLGFYEEPRNGLRIIGHGGDTIYFHSDLHLIPAAGVGFFVSYNSAGNGKGSPRTALYRAFLDRYFPHPQPPATAAPATAARDARAAAGVYESSRRAQTDLMSVAYMLGQVRVSARRDGTITVSALRGLNGVPLRWREVASNGAGPGLYAPECEQGHLVFLRDPTGRRAIAFSPIMELQRVPWYRSVGFNLALLFALCAVLALAVIFWPLGALLRRHYRRRLELSPGRRRLRLVARLVCLLDLIALAGWFQFFAGSSNNIGLMSDASDGQVRLWQVLTLAGVIGTIFIVEYAVGSWMRTRAGVEARLTAAAGAEGAAASAAAPSAGASFRLAWAWARWGETLIALAAIAFVWFVAYWHLLGFGLQY